MGPRDPQWDYLRDIHGIYLVAPIVLLGGLLAFGLWPYHITDMVQSGVAPMLVKLSQSTMGGIF